VRLLQLCVALLLPCDAHLMCGAHLGLQKAQLLDFRLGLPQSLAYSCSIRLDTGLQSTVVTSPASCMACCKTEAKHHHHLHMLY
jgi:hypothetical protein